MSKLPLRNLSESCVILHVYQIVKNRDTRKSKAFRKGAKKGRWRSFLLRALSALSHAYLVRYPSYGPVMQARYRLEMGGVGEALSY